MRFARCDGALSALFGAAALAALTCAPAVAQGAGPQPIGVVKQASGAATVERDGARAAVAAGAPLFEGDVLRTGPDGAMGAVLDDGAAVALGADSAVTLQRFTFRPAESLYDMVLRVLSGRVVVRSGLIGEQAPERIRVETPEMTIGVRGTRFAVVVPTAP